MRKRLFLTLTALFVMALSYAQEYMVFENNNGDFTSLDVSIIKQAYFKTYEPYGSGSVIDPYNVAGANTKSKDIGPEFSAQQYYVKGLVTSITRNANGIAVLYIADDMSGINRLYAYDIRVPLQNNLKKGDEVVIYCSLRNANNVSPEATGQLAAINGQNIETPEPHGSGTESDPFNIAGVIEYVSGLGADVVSPKEVYFKGIITSITEVYGTQYGNATIMVSDTEDGDNKFLCYRVRYFGGQGYRNPNDPNIKVGDEVIMCGKVVNYKGNTPETSANTAWLYSLNGQTEASGGEVNDNRNTSGPMEAQTRLEFPHLKNGLVLVHNAELNKNTQQTGVNYCVEWDTELSSQRWSCYQLYNSINYNSSYNVSRYYGPNDGSLSPTCQYPNDPELPVEYQFKVDPYKFSGYDHGHICPSADRLRSTDCNYQTFLITNMQPQYNKFNAGIWNLMEEDVRKWANMSDTLYICKGGTIDNEEYILEYIHQNSHQTTRVNKDHIPVPRFFYMALLSRKGDTWQAMAYWVPNMNEDHSLDSRKGYALKIDRLEELTGIDFFCNLPDDIEEKVESSLTLSYWF